MSEAEKISSEKWQKMVKNWLKWSRLPDFDGLRTGGFFHPQRKLNLFWYHQYYSEYESGSQSKAQNLLPPLHIYEITAGLNYYDHFNEN